MTSSPILVTRPEPACSETAARLRALGYTVWAAPALVATPLPVRPVVLHDETLIVTSPQAARFLQAWPQLHARPVLAVGAQTAALLHGSGFTDITVGGGTAASLPAMLTTAATLIVGAPSTGQLLLRQLRARGLCVRRLDVYRVVAAAQLPDEAHALLQADAVCVLFYSARTARSFLQLTQGLSLARHQAICLSAPIAAIAGSGGFGQIDIAAQPTAAALEDALQRLAPALGYAV